MEEADLVSSLSALAHPSRMRAYAAIRSGGRNGVSAGEIASALGIRPNVLTPHLAALVASGLVVREDRGSRAILTIDRRAADRVRLALAEALDSKEA